MSSKVSCRPRYAPRQAYRTRLSSSELIEAGELAATALDRPTFSVSELEAIRACRRRHPAPAASGPSSLLLFTTVIGGAAASGLLLGAALALV